jgi:Kef-type K+ transport system membrane component KefB/nucleotide-binding universal stress UspA family protein
MIIAGMIVGPYGFEILERDASFRIFGEVGILYIMFQAAIEIDMYHLKQQYRRGIIFGLLSFAIPMAAGVLGSRYIFGMEWNSSVLVATMYAAHTLLTYPVVGRFGLQNTRAAVIAVCGTIVSVMLALLCLAGVVDVSVTGSFSLLRTARLIGLMVIYCLAIGFIYPKITRLFFRHNVEPVAQFIYILALVFIASLLAQLIGLEAILGAFYAGLMLNKFIPNRSPLMKNIRFVGDAIFIPYFLIGVGMLINVRVIFEGWNVIWLVAGMSTIALASKWLAAFIAQKAFGMSNDDRKLMYGLTGGKAAATIAAVMVGYRHNIISEDIMNGAVVMILICCIVASVTTERAAKRIRMKITGEELEHDEVGHNEYARQVVSVANPVTAEGIMRMAISMRSRRNRNPITALFVRNDTDQRRLAMGRTALTNAATVAQDVDLEVNEEERYDINIVSALRNVAVERDATEIVIGLHRKSNVVDSFFGSMIEQLLSVTDKMIIMSRCFIPVDTITRIVAVVPAKAEYETGFHLWVSRIASLASNIEAKATFIVYKETEEFIRTVIADDRVEFDYGFEIMDSYDDFILLSGDVRDDDLLVIIGARKGSISYSSDIESTAAFLGKHFTRHNILAIYPKQY